MHIGFLKFNNDVERAEKMQLFNEVENLDKVYATNGDSFEEFLATVVSEGDTIYVPSLSNCYSELQPLLRILDYLKANQSVKIIVLEGVLSDFWFGATTGQGAKAAKDFNKMLASGQIS